MNDRLIGSLQENCLALVCTSDEHCQIVRNAVPLELFSTLLYRDIVARVYAYIDEYKKAPGVAHLPDLLEDLLQDKGERGEAVLSLLENIDELAPSINPKYVVTQLEKFNRGQSLRLGAVEMMRALQADDLDEAEAAIQRALKTRLNLFDPGLTLEMVAASIGHDESEAERVMLGIPEFDRHGFGPGRREIWIILADTGKGKTWALSHCSKRALMQRWKVAVASLEYGAQKYGQRILQGMFSYKKREDDKFSYPVFEVTKDEDKLVSVVMKTAKRPALDNAEDLKRLRKKVKEYRQRDYIRIKSFPTGQLTISALNAWLDGMEAQEGFIPDLLVVDYPRLMKQDEKNLRVSLGQTIIDLRGIAVERNIAVATATQGNRDGGDAKTMGRKFIGEDYSITQTADICIAYSQTQTEYEMQIARLTVDKGRDDADRFSVLISQAYSSGQFVLDSRPLDRDYWAFLEGMKSHSASADGDDD